MLFRTGLFTSLCQSGVDNTCDDLWFPGGASLDFLPSPTPDPDRPYGNVNCKDCPGFCAGHYLNPNKRLALVKERKSLPKLIPPSEVLSKVFGDSQGFPSDEKIVETAKTVLLKPEELRMWFEHLQIVQDNRKKGAKKAAATRRAKKKRTAIPSVTNEECPRDSDGDEVCNLCFAFNPPNCKDGEAIDWVACDICSMWFHRCCAGLQNIPNAFHCNNCD